MLTLKIISVIAALATLPVAYLVRSEPGKGGDAEDHTIPAGNVRQLKVKVPFGNIQIRTDGSSYQMHAKRWIVGSDSADGKRWVETSKLETSVKDGVLTVEELPFGERKGGKRLDHAGTVHYELTLSIPKGAEGEIQLGAGDLRVQGGYGRLTTSVGAGSVKLNGLTVDGDLALQVGAGEIHGDLDQNSARDIRADIGTGSIDLTFPVSLDAQVEATVGMGEIKGLPGRERRGMAKLSDRRLATFGEGKTKVDLHVGVGDIAFAGPKDGKAAQIERDVEREDADDTLDIAASALKNGPKDIETDEDSDALVSRAVASADDTVDQAQIRRDVQRALHESRESVRLAMATARQEVQRAMREAQADLEREQKAHSKRAKHGTNLNRDVQRTVVEALRTARQAVDAALQSAQAALEKGE